MNINIQISEIFVPLQTALSTGSASISSGRHDVDPEAVATGCGELRLCPLKRSCGAFSSSFSRRTLNKLPELTPHEENACIFEESPSSAPQLSKLVILKCSYFLRRK